MDERELILQYKKTGDVALRNRIAEQYLYIASMLAKKFVGRGVDYDDLYQVASLALLKAIERYDPDVGVKFSTFVTPTITGEIKNYFRDRSRLIHLPRQVAQLRMEIKRTAEQFLSSEGRSPTAKELAKRLKVSEEEVVSAMEAGSVVSLDRPVDESSDEGSFYDMLPADNDAFEALERRDAVASAMKLLSEKEKELVRLRFGKELSQTETAKRMNVSQMYISRMERKILEKLRENLKKSEEE